MQRLRVIIRGAVQGVGFRPFVYRLATEMKLPGWVVNSSQGVFIEVEGDSLKLGKFLERIDKEKPANAFIQSMETSYLAPAGYCEFEVRQSDGSGAKTALIMPDLATCEDCFREIFEPSDRRYRYPFTNCTNCGPRFSIIENLPYDRVNTSMKAFVMCDRCLDEYNDPSDRRFHAQPNACPICGPQLALWNSRGKVLETREEALQGAVDAVRRGEIVAIKGLGGFHIMVDARNEEAVRRLRQLKNREEKPFAVMFPSLDSVMESCTVSALERRILLSPESPIVLVRRKESHGAAIVADSVAPGNPNLGVVLPYTPLHHLLMTELAFPVVATSGNRADEPICTDEHEALERLKGVAELFLVHDRPIVRHVDDSIVRLMAGRELVIRRARGYAPLPIMLKHEVPSALAVGAHLKNTVAVSVGQQVFSSQHIGDLETEQAYDAFEHVIESLTNMYGVEAVDVVCDLHPDYISTKFAGTLGKPLLQVQHHYAHLLSCAAENEISPPFLGAAWDGTGYGTDGTIWGGEFLLVTETGFARAGHLRTFPLPGGERAIVEPRRAALGVLFQIFGDAALEMDDIPAVSSFSKDERNIVRKILKSGINCPITSSAGRLFDAVCSIVGKRQLARYEGQAAMELEYACDSIDESGCYPFVIIDEAERKIIDWQQIILHVIGDLKRDQSTNVIAARFHNTMSEIIVEMAKRVGEKQVALSGGCFQNKYLTERTVRRLESEGFAPFWHQRIPANDGGISLGQIAALAGRERRE